MSRPSKNRATCSRLRGVIGTGEIDLARGDAGGQHHLVEAGQLGGIGAGAEAQLHTGFGQFVAEVAQGLVELFLAGDALGHVELAADLIIGVEQGDQVAALGSDGGTGQAGGAGTDHRNLLRRSGGAIDQLGLVRGARIDQGLGRFGHRAQAQAGRGGVP